MIDSQGRLFGRFNVVDALAVLFVLGLVPVGYATYLLFRPATPEITAVERVNVTREELRVAGGSLITAKVKLRGSGFTPMLRARIGETPALGFVFENPNSADVIIGDVPPGTHDVVLLDGVQEVARAREAVTIDAAPTEHIRAAGYLIGMTQQRAQSFKEGDAYPAADPRMRILALGVARQGHTRFMVGGQVSDVSTPDRWERPAVVALRCDPRAFGRDCSIGGVALEGRPVVTLHTAETSVRFAIDEVFPDATPTALTVLLRVAGGSELRGISVGDRDDLLDERAAVITRVGNAAPNGTLELTVKLGADSSRNGLRYRGQIVHPGAELILTFPRTRLRGVIQSIQRDAEEASS